MNIALIGYGKMGKAIEEIAIERGHNINAKINSTLTVDLADWSNTDVCIEFTRPELAANHIEFCAKKQIPIVVGTTAWYDELDRVRKTIIKNNSALLYASNFSVGVNLFFELNRHLALLMEGQKSYTLSVEETHHIQKLDAPSGTAISLLEDILKINLNYKGWSLRPNNQQEIEVQAHRLPNIPGTHKINYDSDIDSIQIQHIAHNRKGFALGAVLAAEFIFERKGIFTMSDVLKITP